ncbi:hypothetical protein [Agrobacterium sp. CG674]
MSSAEEIMKALVGEIGKNDNEATVKTYLDTGFPPLNHGASSDWDGGIGVGRMGEIAGPPSAGKTAIATEIMACAQRMGGVAGFGDHERSLSFKLAEKLGLDTTPGRFIYRTPRTFEESLQICVVAATIIREKKLIPKDAPICWVFDSLAAMVPRSALYEMKAGKIVGEKSLEDRNMNDNTALARATSNAFPAFNQHVEELGIAAIFLNQLRTDINVKFGDPRKSTGGNAPAFYFSWRLWLSASQIKHPKDGIIGQEVTGKFMKNKISRPFQEAKWRFVYQPDGTGRFDKERSLVEFLAEENCFDEKAADGKTPGPGKVIWEGKQIFKEALARLIEAEGPAGYDKLKARLPAKYEPPVVAVVDTDEEGLAEAA